MPDKTEIYRKARELLKSTEFLNAYDEDEVKDYAADAEQLAHDIIQYLEEE